jgi:hypothetical protein
LEACDYDRTCILAYITIMSSATVNCKLMTGLAAVDFRTAVRALSSAPQLVQGIAKEVGAACREDADCQTGICNVASKLCAASKCRWSRLLCYGSSHV